MGKYLYMKTTNVHKLETRAMLVQKCISDAFLLFNVRDYKPVEAFVVFRNVALSFSCKDL